MFTGPQPSFGRVDGPQDYKAQWRESALSQVMFAPFLVGPAAGRRWSHGTGLAGIRYEPALTSDVYTRNNLGNKSLTLSNYFSYFSSYFSLPPPSSYGSIRLLSSYIQASHPNLPLHCAKSNFEPQSQPV